MEDFMKRLRTATTADEIAEILNEMINSGIISREEIIAELQKY